MRIATTAQALTGFEIVVMEDIQPATMEPAKKYGTDENDQYNGKPVYRLNGIYVKVDGRHDEGVSVKVLNKPAEPIAELSKVRLTGNVVITPWIRNSRQAYSIIADGVEPEHK